MWFFRSPGIVFGKESLSFLNNLTFRKILVVTDSNIERLGLVELIKKELPEGSTLHVISSVPEEPTLADIKELVPEASNFGPDLIIGLGGGSCMDASKSLFALYERPDLDIYDITPLVPLNLRKKARLILIPTTSGTGSECSWAAVLSDASHKRKNELASPEIIADYAILDPALVSRLPRSITRNTAVDAITHAIEGGSSQWHNVYSDIFSEKAIELITNNITSALDDSEPEARENVHIGASMAGLAFSNSQIGLAHAMGHSLGAHFRVPHGMSVGLYLPSVVDFSERSAQDRYAKMNSLFPVKYRKSGLGATLREFFLNIGQPLFVDQCGIDSIDYGRKIDSLVQLAEESTGTVTNPREAEGNEIADLFRGVIRGEE